MKNTDLPHEVFLQIFRNLQPTDKFTCLTVCKQWFPAAEDSIYAEALVSSWKSFTLLADKIKNYKLLLGSKVIVLELRNTKKWNLYTDERQAIATSKMNILKRYCVNLKELDFDSTDFFWEYLKSMNWEDTWPHLRKLPPYNDDLAMYTYGALGHRLISTTFVWPGKVAKEMMDILLTMKQLKSLTLDQNNNVTISLLPNEDGGFRWGPELETINIRRPFSIYFLKQIFESLPNLRHLNIKCLIKNLFTESAVLPPLTSLESFTCSILNSDSAWFPIIKTNFANIPHLNLSMILSTIQAYDNGNSYVRPLTDLYKHLNVKRVTLSFSSQNRGICINDYLRAILRRTDHIQPSIYVSLNIYDPDTLTNNIKQKYKISSTRKGDGDDENHTIIHHDIQFQTILDTTEINELGHLSDMIGITYYDTGEGVDSSLNRLERLRLNRIILKHGKHYDIDLDKLLFKLPCLQHLSLSSENRIVSNQAPASLNLEETLFFYSRQPVQDTNQEGYYYQLKISFKHFLKDVHPHLHTLDLKHICVDLFVFNFILNKCPKLKQLNITDCVIYQDNVFKKVEQEALPHIWLECSYKDIIVCIK